MNTFCALDITHIGKCCDNYGAIIFLKLNLFDIYYKLVKCKLKLFFPDNNLHIGIIAWSITFEKFVTLLVYAQVPSLLAYSWPLNHSHHLDSKQHLELYMMSARGRGLNSAFNPTIGHINNIPTMQLFTGISRHTQSKSYMLSLTECVWKLRNNALWDTR